jgi:hypothetical protein
MRRRKTGAVKIDEAAAIIVSANPGGAGDAVMRYDWQVGDTDTVGIFEGEFEVTFPDASIKTYPNEGYITINVTKEAK